MLKALIFDVDGTLADTEMAHLAAFNHAFSEMGFDWRWDVPLYRSLLSVSGGKERIKAYWLTQSPEISDISGSGIQETIDRLHALKTAAYEQAVQDSLVAMRPGVLALLSAAKDADLQLAIATTTSKATKLPSSISTSPGCSSLCDCAGSSFSASLLPTPSLSNLPSSPAAAGASCRCASACWA